MVRRVDMHRKRQSNECARVIQLLGLTRWARGYSKRVRAKTKCETLGYSTTYIEDVHHLVG